MSQPRQKPAASPRPRRAAAARHTQEHVNEKTSGSPSKPGGKKGSDEEKAANPGSSQPSRSHAGGKTLATKMSTSSGTTSKSSTMNPKETKEIPVSQQMEGPHPPNKKRHRKQAVKTDPAEPEKSPSTKTSVVHEKKPQEGKPKEHTEPKNLPKHASDKGGKHAHSEKAVSKSNEQLTSEKSTEPKTKSQDTVSAGGESAIAGVAATTIKPDDKKKEKKLLTAAVAVESKPEKLSEKSGMDAALDDLIDTLGEPEETNDDNTTYTGPEVLDQMTSRYIEELGKREITIPPKYRELLAKKEGITEPPPDSLKPMGPDDAIDALSSDFTCSPTADEKKTEKEKSAGDVLKAQSVGVIRSAVPPKEKKRKLEEDAMSDQAFEALSASLGTRKSEPELDLSTIKEINEAKAKEEKQEKCGEDDETVPTGYRLKPVTDKDGKLLLPELEEKLKPLSESELIAELSEDFGRSKSKEKQSKPTEKTEKDKVAAPTTVAETVSRTSMCSIQSAPPKPASMDKDGKPLLAKEPKEQLPPMSDEFLLNALSEDFAGNPDISSLEFSDDKLSAVISEVVSQTPASATHPAKPPPDNLQRDKELDDALDKLSDSLGQRQPDPDESKPMEDKVKERTKAEHRDKLGERDDTIPPEYRHLLDDDGQDKKEASSSKSSQNGGEAKDSEKTVEEASKPKSDERKTS
ncbi:calpastatin isoform X9 [Ictidomys tridecemlineatus]|uniref:calpastatin isoform X9 n=1 Tax=Ictidomys tridecemlineatus TaxID=43179 RepID=UPI000B5410B6|nr:calpastatin isoform X9 [Ictidomys tridecemlineatus]KAG3266334.1 calpastatin, transcript variant X9 [Ictidomys tridecemlineatus]